MNLSSYDIENLQLAKKIINQDLSRHYTIPELAHKVAMGPSKLKEGFKKQFGIGLYTYLRNLRMQLAYELVSQQAKTNKQIAKLCGYKYVTNFLSAFIKYHKLSPREIRKTK